MTDRILSLLGICRRAGKLIIGADPSIDSIQKNKAKLIIFASDFSKSSANPVLASAHENGITTLTLDRNKDEVSFAVGKLCGVAAIEDKGFADKLKMLVENELGGELYGKV